MFHFDPPSLALKDGEHTLQLDSHGDEVFVSHAHSDHAFASKRAKHVIATPATLDLMRVKGYPLNGTFGQKGTNGTSLELLPAGHMLGASQIQAKLDGGVFTYTGDFKLSKSITCPGASVPQTDELLIEATFGSPEYVFPDTSELYREIGQWADANTKSGKIAVIAGYAMGKAQELVGILNQEAGLTPLVTPDIHAICQVYSQHGVHLDCISTASEEGQRFLAQRKSFAAVIPVHQLGGELTSALYREYGRGVATAVATGWALTGVRTWGAQKAFPLSDHADYNELLRYVEESGAKKIYTTYGSSERFASELRAKGYDAKSVDVFKKPKPEGSRAKRARVSRVAARVPAKQKTL